MTERLERVLEALRVEVPAKLDRVPRRTDRPGGRCLPATRIGLEALRYFGVDARPMPTRVLATNVAWREWMEAGGEPPMPEPAWSVATGWPSPGAGVDLHLVLEVDGRLLDLDAGQFSRPARDIVVPATLDLPLGEREGRRWAGSALERGGVITYVEHPDPPVWKAAPDWRGATKHAGEVIRRVRDSVSGS